MGICCCWPSWSIVVTTDVGAYFAGRGFGGPLLSPKDSPEQDLDGRYRRAGLRAGLRALPWRAPEAGTLRTGWCSGLRCRSWRRLGDLLESRFKRLYGVKDTSGFICRAMAACLTGSTG